ncbi:MULTISPECIES: acyltransferase family protein [unclassified Microbulbifer]|uniref:acyltransferase family protein n=1 Tax=unclassified Microbulbifer TaxID=2619833 RepID=UPI0027E3F7B6|nr:MULTISPECIES: acyltransferase family protein [unclassified Microbulbifer]
MTATIESNRLDYLDAVRAFALLLGIVFHASLSFLPIFIGWAVMDVSTSYLLSNVVMVSHSFRMELFFLIAGFFSHMTFHRQGAGSFLQSRLIRIAIPFVVGWFILRPLLVASWAMGSESMRGEVNILSGLKIGFQSLAELPKGLFTGSHLWFLYYLLLVTGITLGLRSLIGLRPQLREFLTRKVDSAITRLSDSRFALIVLAALTAISLWHMKLWGMDTPDQSLAPHLPVLLVYGSFFLLGWLLQRQQSLIGQFARLSIATVALCIAGIATSVYLAKFQLESGHPQITLIRVLFVAGYAIMMWTLVAVGIGLFKRFFDKPSKLVRYIADSSYWVYLIHLPIVVWLQIAFAEVALHWSLKLVAISAITIGLSLILYDLVVRSTAIGMVLNGRRRDRVLFAFPGLLSAKLDEGGERG